MPALAGIQYHSIRVRPRAGPNLARDDSLFCCDLQREDEEANVRLGRNTGLRLHVGRRNVALTLEAAMVL
jgi:hypothetical protein